MRAGALYFALFPFRTNMCKVQITWKSRDLHYQSLFFCLVSKLSAQRRFKKKECKEGRADKWAAACCISIPAAEWLSVCLWQQPREGDTLCILTRLVYLSLCHCLSLPLSVSACLSLHAALLEFICCVPPSTLLRLTLFFSTLNNFLRGRLLSPYHSISGCHRSVYLPPH